MEETRADRIEMPAEIDPENLCVRLDTLESAVTLGQQLRLFVRGSDEAIVVQPTDVSTREGGDYLHYRTAQGESKVVDVRQLERVETL
jgi:hypothetical protein